jgi:peroxiredoxin
MAHLTEGNPVPQVTFKTRVRDESIGGDNPFRWQDLTTDDIFKGKKVILSDFREHLHQPAHQFTPQGMTPSTMS